MEDLVQNLTSLLARHFPGSTLEIEPAGGDRFGGFLIWEGFSDMEQIERQRRIWSALRRDLSSTDQLRVSAILSLTPEEMTAAREG